ncbi:MAG: choice-of-anchor L domain-containing protein [Saprospirales bacterium]|nr:choice-of-anchor L domain-containing protein [Saprospirales bacterium]
MCQRETQFLILFFSLVACAGFAQNAPVLVQLTGTPYREPLNIFEGKTAVQICGLTPGNTYQVIANAAYPGQEVNFRLRLATPEQESAAQAISPANRPQLRQFEASGPCAAFLLETTTPGPSAEVPMYLSIGCVDGVEAGPWTGKFAQDVADLPKLSVTQGNAAGDLVTNVLIGGNCFDVTNISSKGAANSRGTFAQGQSSINISQGIVLCTGPVAVLPGPNSLPNTNGGFGNNSANDPHLGSLTSGQDQYDVSVIEFDFKPTANSVRFEFVFGSEEYCEYVNSIYNDVFGFFISGPGITGVRNLAVLPDGITPVAVNDVNHLKNSIYYRNNNSSGTCLGQPLTNMTDIQLDGFTTVLTAIANVVPCQTYHIKLAIADIGDANYTSAVFLRANSFDAGGKVLANAVYPASANFTQEGCTNGYIRFYRGTGDNNQALPVNYTLAPGSSATVGVDFAPLPASITIPAGQTELLVPVDVIKDQIPEGVESFTLLLENSCSCDQQDVTFVIQDQTPLDVGLADQTVCSGSVTLSPAILSGGFPPLTYLWSNGQTGTDLLVSDLGSNIFTVTVTDVCGLSATASATATVDVLPTATISGNVQFCAGGTSQLPLNFTGAGPWTVGLNAAGTAQTQTFYTNPAALTISQPGAYTLTSVITQAGCPGVASGSGTAQEIAVNLALNATHPLCFGDPGALQASITSNASSYQLAWNNGATTPNLANLPAGNYSLTVTTPQGCTAVASTTLTQPAPLVATIGAVPVITCYQPQVSANVSAQGGTSAYQYQWSNGLLQAVSAISVGGTYTVTVTDAHQCSASATVAVEQNTTPPVAVAVSADEITCNTPEVILNSAGSSVGPNFIYTWNTLGGHIITSMEEPSATVDAAGAYTLMITNTANGCTASSTALVIENTNRPEGFDLLIAQPGCEGKPGTIRVQAVQGGEGPFVFSMDGGNTFLNQSAFSNLQAGAYSIVVQDANGCEYAQSFELVAPIEPEIEIEPEVQLAFGETAELTALLNIPLFQIDTIVWAPLTGLTPSGRPDVVLARPFKTNWYTVQVVSIDGCVDEAQITIRVGHPDIYAPNAIRPGSTDGKNHMFMLFARENAVNQINQLQIFDRWGNMVFGRDHIQPNDDRAGGWDGHFNGKLLEPGVFTWWAEIELASGENIQLKGDVTIVD